MAIIKTGPFREIERIFNDDDWFFPAVRRTFGPPMDIYQTDKEVVVEVQLPKIDPKNVDVSVEEGVLKVEGKEEQVTEDKDGKNYIRREIRSGSFVRMVGLPAPVKESQIQAVYENGVLKITLPKAEPKSKKIEVKINNPNQK
jgi:HSP20 family protein